MKRCVLVSLIAFGLLGCGQKPVESASAVATSVPGSTPASPVSAAPVATPVAAPVEPAPPKTFTIAAGTRLRVRTTSTLSTKVSRSGERFTATLTEPIVVDGTLLVPKGANVQGVISNSDPGGRVKGRASLSVRLTAIESPGKDLSIATAPYTVVAKGTKKKDAMKVGIGTGIGAAIGAIAGGGAGAAMGAGAGAGAGTGYVLATHGDPAVISSESLLNFQLRSPVTVSR